MGCVYKITSPNGKGYVGITRGCHLARFKVHKREATAGRSALNAAMRKHGVEGFTIKVLEVHEAWADLCAAEVRLIASEGTKSPRGYNLTGGGEGCPELDPDVQARRTAASAAGRKGLKLSDSHRKALSDAHKGLPSNMRGKRFSAESKKKMSEAALRRWKNPEQRAWLTEHLRKLNNG